MWKITIKYDDGGIAKIKGKHKDIPLSTAKTYYKQFKCELSSRTAIYQKYPLRDNEPISLIDKISQLEREREEC